MNISKFMAAQTNNKANNRGSCTSRGEKFTFSFEMLRGWVGRTKREHFERSIVDNVRLSFRVLTAFGRPMLFRDVRTNRFRSVIRA
jgi:hypothetical protein